MFTVCVKIIWESYCDICQNNSNMWLFLTSLSRVTDLFCRHAEDLKMSESGSERGSAPSTISFKSARSDRSKGNVPVFGIKPKSSRKRWDYHVNSSVEILFCNQGENHNIVYMQTYPLSPVTDIFCSLAEDLKMSESGSERGSAPSTISFKSARSNRSKGNVPVFSSETKLPQTRWEFYCLTEWKWSLFDSFDLNLLYIKYLWCQYQACWW